jgi:septal ring factor EnvC (AmiA/AmiB activator)
MRLRLIFLAALTIAPPAVSIAQDAQDLEALTRAESEARETEAKLRADRERITKEIAALKAELARVTAQTQAYERENLRIADRLAQSTAELAQLEEQLSETRAQTQTLFAALQRLQLAPSAAIISNPDDAVQTAQAATMIDLLSTELKRRADDTVALAAQATEVRNEAARQQEELAANRAELERRQVQTQRLVKEKETLQASIRSEEYKARAEALRLAAEAQSLRELLEQVAAIPESVAPRIKPDAPSQTPQGPVTLPPGTVRFAEARGGVVRPVSGRISQGFGRGSQGQTYSARSQGQVIAPYAGRVEFVGPFRTYGQVVILNLNDGYYLLLTGLGDTFVSVNETVTRGEPVGRMPSGSGRKSLYVELRRNGRPIDPEPWMGARR